MNRRRTLGITLSLAVVTPLLVASAVAWLDHRWNAPETLTFDGPIATTSITRYTTRPANRDEIKFPLLPVPLPPEATNIQFAEYREYAAAEQFVRLEAPPAVCLAYAKALLDDHNRQNPTNPVPTDLKPVQTPGTGKATPSETPAPWFTPESIPHALETGAAGGHQPKLWLDPDNGVLYYQYTD